MEIEIRSTVGVVVFDRACGRYLILRRNPKRYKGWGLIKGGVKPDETVESACIRETKEEIGITLDASVLSNLSHQSAYFDNTKQKIVLVRWFIAPLSSAESLILEEDEWVAHRWATYDEALYELVWQTQQRVLRVAHQNFSEKD